MRRYLLLLPGLLLLLSLCSCSRPENEIVQKSEVLAQASQFKEAYDMVQNSLKKKEFEKNKALLRQRVRILLMAKRVDLAYAHYRDLTKEISKNDSILVDSLKDKSPDVRESAARALGLTIDPTTNKPLHANTVSALVKVLEDSDYNVRRAAVDSLGQMRDTQATDAVIAALKDSHWWVRSDAASALGRLRDSRAVEPLFAILDDPDPSVRRAVENALATLVRQPDRSPYLRALDHPDPKVMRSAALALALVQEPAANAKLALLAQSPDAAVRQLAIRGFRFSKDPANLPALRQALSDPEWSVRGEALVGVLELRDVESLPQVNAIAADKKEREDVRKFAAEVAAKLKTPAR